MHPSQIEHLQLWQNALASNKVHHAWMFAGPRGAGKSVFAMEAARQLLRREGSADAGFDPDVIVVQREFKNTGEAKRTEGQQAELRRNITVAQIRTLQQRLTTRLSDGGHRAIIIDSADDLEAAAANALLKSLEEPSVGTVFLLVAHQPARLLPTIRSRCRVLRFSRTTSRPDDGEMDRELMMAITSLIDARGNDISPFSRFISALGTKPPRAGLQTALAVAASKLQGDLPATHLEFAALEKVLSEIRRLETELATFNYDPDLLAARIGSLLHRLAAPIGIGDG